MDNQEKAHLALCKQSRLLFPPSEHFKPQIKYNFYSIFFRNQLIQEITKEIVEVFKVTGISVYQKNGLIYFINGYWNEYVNPMLLRKALGEAASTLGVNNSIAKTLPFRDALLKQFLFGSEIETITPVSSCETFQRLISDIDKKEQLYLSWTLSDIDVINQEGRIYLKNYINELQNKLQPFNP